MNFVSEFLKPQTLISLVYIYSKKESIILKPQGLRFSTLEETFQSFLG